MGLVFPDHDSDHTNQVAIGNFHGTDCLLDFLFDNWPSGLENRSFRNRSRKITGFS